MLYRPQLIVLGHLLVIIFVSVFSYNILAPISQFAHDTGIFIAGDDSADIANRISVDLQEAKTIVS